MKKVKIKEVKFFCKTMKNLTKEYYKLNNILNEDYIDKNIGPILDSSKEQIFKGMFGISTDTFHKNVSSMWDKETHSMLSDILTNAMYYEGFSDYPALVRSLNRGLNANNAS